ncbi:acyltransferase [Rhizobium sp. YTUHZ045]|uniref:acyltransferase family protein n=1 Tax=Rhizobium sp. YTUHZ045 TaxID=2962888 RepID=UPI003DA844F7
MLTKQRPPEILSLQYLRALAAIGVLLYHRFEIFWIGAYGVDLFFVISGFVMIATTDAKDKSPSAFLLDRVIRVVPMYWIAILSAGLLVWIGIPVHQYDASIIPVISSMLFIPYENMDGETWPVILQGWTLNYEMYFYAVFSLILFIRQDLRIWALTGCFVALVTLGQIAPPQGAAFKIYTNSLLLEFLAGAILGRTYGLTLQNVSVLRAVLISIILAGSLFACSHLLGRLAWSGLAVLVVVAALTSERLGWAPNVSWLRFLGAASFSIYIFQQLFFTLSGTLLSDLTALSGINFRYLWFWRPMDVAIAAGGGALIYMFIEKPVGRYLKSISLRAKVVAA